MKYLISLLICVTLFLSVNAQEKDAITEALESSPAMEITSDLLKLSKETQNGFTSYINATVDVAEKKWKEFVSAKYQIELKKSKGALVAENVSMPEISSSSVTVTTVFSEDESGCKMDVFYVMNGYYLNSKDHPKETLAVLASLKSYQKSLYVEVYENTINKERKKQDKEQKSLEKLTKEGVKLSKDMKGEEDDINKAEQEIIDAEKKMTELQAKIEELTGEIAQSRSLISELSEAKEKKQEEIELQGVVVAEKTAKIERLKGSAERVNN